MIFDFMLMLGDCFFEIDIVQKLQFSCMLLCQVLQWLVCEGFLQVFLKFGWQVVLLDFDVIDELYDLCMFIECYVVQMLVGQELCSMQFQVLVDFWMVFVEQCLVDVVEVGMMDEDFYIVFVVSSGNCEMVCVYQGLMDCICIVWCFDFIKLVCIVVIYDEYVCILCVILCCWGDEVQCLLCVYIEQSKLEVWYIMLEVLYCVCWLVL